MAAFARLFLALTLPDEVINQVQQLRSHWPQDDKRIRWTSLTNLHLTLHFLGSVPTTNIQPLTRDLQNSLQDVPSFAVTTGNPGVLPTSGHARILMLKLSDPDRQLSDLARTLHSRCREHGILVPDRDYHPHITLARWKPPQPRAKVQHLLDQLPAVTGIPVLCDAVSLVQSTLTSTHAVHEEVARIALQAS